MMTRFLCRYCKQVKYEDWADKLLNQYTCFDCQGKGENQESQQSRCKQNVGSFAGSPPKKRGRPRAASREQKMDKNTDYDILLRAFKASKKSSRKWMS